MGYPEERWRHDDIFYVGDVKFTPPQYQYYGKRAVLKHISKTAKHSNERAAMIAFMIDQKWVPVKAKCFYELIRRTEEDRLPVGDEHEWGKVGRPSKEAASRKKIRDIRIPVKRPSPGAAYGVDDKAVRTNEPKYEMKVVVRDSDIFPHHDNHMDHRKNNEKKIVLDYDNAIPKPALWGQTAWRGSIFLTDLSPVQMDVHSGEIIALPRQYDTIDICSYLGKYLYPGAYADSFSPAERNDEPVCRLYFDPKKYPRPRGGAEKSFNELRDRIRRQSKQSGSPVICNGGGERKRRFVCCHNQRSNGKGAEAKTTKCKFQFEVQWDDSGYYIQILSRRNRHSDHSSGCPWHTAH